MTDKVKRDAESSDGKGKGGKSPIPYERFAKVVRQKNKLVEQTVILTKRINELSRQLEECGIGLAKEKTEAKQQATAPDHPFAKEISRLSEFKYKGYTIHPAPLQLQNGLWNHRVIISSYRKDKWSVGKFFSAASFRTCREAIIHGVIFGIQIVDGSTVPDYSVKTS